MAMGSAGGLFVGALKPPDKAFLKPLMRNARAAGYTRFVEPFAGALAMSYLAAESGYRPEQIEASDVSFFSGVFGRAVSGRSIEDMEIEAEGFSAEEMKDPATALYAQLYLRMLPKAGALYYDQMLEDLRYLREEHVRKIQEQIDRCAARLKGMSYRDLCAWAHLREAKDDEHALIVMCPPTYTAGYETFFDTGGKLRWKEPEYEIFDVKTGIEQILSESADAKALVIVYEEKPTGQAAGVPVYGRRAGRPGMQMYLTSNRPEEAERLAGGAAVSTPNPSKLVPLKCSILPVDYDITDRSKLEVGRIKPENCAYYRKLWTHNFTNDVNGSGYAMYIDGHLAGVFGYDKLTSALGGKTDLTLKFGIGAPSVHRLNRLLYVVASSRDIVSDALDDVEKMSIRGIATTMITKYPESKEMRGLMKMVDRVEDRQCGFKLKYRCDLRDMTLGDALSDWYRRELKWEKSRKQATR